MQKYSKRQYNKDVAANDAAALSNELALQEFQARLDAGESIDVLSDDWNAEHDRTYEIEQERRVIESRFAQRNWTWQDHAFHDLVMNNID